MSEEKDDRSYWEKAWDDIKVDVPAQVKAAGKALAAAVGDKEADEYVRSAAKYMLLYKKGKMTKQRCKQSLNFLRSGMESRLRSVAVQKRNAVLAWVKEIVPALVSAL